MPTPKILIIVRVGARSTHDSWMWMVRGLADIALSSYQENDYSRDPARYFHDAKGGKFQGVADFLSKNPGVIDDYDYFWLFEDDLYLPRESLQNVLRFLEAFPASLVGPTTTYYSYYAHVIGIQNTNFVARAVDFVDLMAPIMSRNFIKEALPYFSSTFSAWGQEWLWRRLLVARGEFGFVLDCAPIVNTRPNGKGTIYANMSQTVSAKDEMDAFIKANDLDSTAFRNFFGISASTPRRLLTGDGFIDEMIEGYKHIAHFDVDLFARCIVETKKQMENKKYEELLFDQFTNEQSLQLQEMKV